MNKKIILMTAIIYGCCFIGIDIKNTILNGAPYVVTGDLLDSIKFYSSFPGTIPAFAVILVIYQNIHNYNYWVFELATLLFSSIFYGFTVNGLFNLGKRMKAQQINRADSE